MVHISNLKEFKTSDLLNFAPQAKFCYINGVRATEQFWSEEIFEILNRKITFQNLNYRLIKNNLGENLIIIDLYLDKENQISLTNWLIDQQFGLQFNVIEALSRKI
uniref:Uncharacterized protein n=1 Tax=Romanomermis culicivorax TaxID=13658 RepID=A0A915JKR4_ROMCU